MCKRLLIKSSTSPYFLNLSLGLLGQYIKIYTDYLQNRSFTVRAGSFFSNPKPNISSVPQGSISGSTVFNIYVNDIHREPDVDLAIFADDTAMLHKHKLQVYTKLQNYLNKISAWLKKMEN